MYGGARVGLALDLLPLLLMITFPIRRCACVSKYLPRVRVVEIELVFHVRKGNVNRLQKLAPLIHMNAACTPSPCQQHQRTPLWPGVVDSIDRRASHHPAKHTESIVVATAATRITIRLVSVLDSRTRPTSKTQGVYAIRMPYTQNQRAIACISRVWYSLA